MEIIEQIEMLLVDVDNNGIDYDFIDDHAQVFDLTPRGPFMVLMLSNGRKQWKKKWML